VKNVDDAVTMNALLHKKIKSKNSSLSTRKELTGEVMNEMKLKVNYQK
jgi:hypothetical protein